MKANSVAVTRHAEKRIRQRLGINKSATERAAEKAMKYGITHKDSKGSLHRYLDSVFLAYRKANNLRVYNRNVYLFGGTTLITVIPLPSNLWVYADKLQRQKTDSALD